MRAEGRRSDRLAARRLIAYTAAAFLAAPRLMAQGADPAPAPRSISFAEAMTRALASNLDLRLSRADTGFARAQLIGSRLRPNPSLSLEYLTTGERSGGGFEGDGTIAVTQDLQLFGVRSKRMEAAALEQRRAIYSVLDAERLIRREVAASYRELLFERQRVSLLDSVIMLNQRVFRVAQLAVEQGLGSELDARLSDAAAQQSLLDRDRASREYDIGQLEFARLLGDSLGTVYSLTDSLAPTSLPFLAVSAPTEGAPEVVGFALSDAGADSLVRIALAARPDVRAAEYAVQAGAASLRLAQALGKPTVAVGGLVARSRDNFAIGAEGGQDVDLAVGVGVVIGLPIGNRNEGEIARAQVAISAATTRLKNTRLLVERDVRTAAQRVVLNATQVETLRQRILPRNTSALRIAEAAFGRGQANIFQILQVQRTYVESITGLLEALRQYAAALAELESALGQPVQ